MRSPLPMLVRSGPFNGLFAALESSGKGDGDGNPSSSSSGGGFGGVVSVPACSVVSSEGSSVFTCLPGAAAVF